MHINSSPTSSPQNKSTIKQLFVCFYHLKLHIWCKHDYIIFAKSQQIVLYTHVLLMYLITKLQSAQHFNVLPSRAHDNVHELQAHSRMNNSDVKSQIFVWIIYVTVIVLHTDFASR